MRHTLPRARRRLPKKPSRGHRGALSRRARPGRSNEARTDPVALHRTLTRSPLSGDHANSNHGGSAWTVTFCGGSGERSVTSQGGAQHFVDLLVIGGKLNFSCATPAPVQRCASFGGVAVVRIRSAGEQVSH